MLNHKKVCIRPFNKIEITCNGDVYTCCPQYINYRSIGNLFDENINTIEDLWFSEKIMEHRKKLLNGDYSLCNIDICREKYLVEADGDLFSEKSDILPEYVTLAYDRECNIQCITCRDELIKNTFSQNKLIESKFDSLLLPLLKNAKIISISGSGEAFYGKHSRDLIKKIAEINKKVKFNIYTNGILFNQRNCIELGIENRLNKVFVSVHSLKEDVYNKIMVGSNLKIVLENIKYIAELQKSKKIEYGNINCVISNLNYTEIPAMIDFAKNYNFRIYFSVYLPWGTQLDKKYNEFEVWNPSHENYPKLIEVLKIAKSQNYDNCIFTPVLEKLMN